MCLLHRLHCTMAVSKKFADAFTLIFEMRQHLTLYVIDVKNFWPFKCDALYRQGEKYGATVWSEFGHKGGDVELNHPFFIDLDTITCGEEDGLWHIVECMLLHGQVVVALGKLYPHSLPKSFRANVVTFAIE